MSAFLTLFKITLDNHFSLSAMQVKYLRQRQRLWEPILISFAIFSAAVSFGGMFFMMTRGIIAGSPPGQSDLALTMFILAAQVLALVLGLFTMVSLFYFSTDLNILVPLPLKEGTILAAKFGIATLTEYLPSLLFVVPPLLAYNQFVPLRLSGWISAVLVFILLPLAPLSIAGIVAVTMMRGINRRHRDVLMVIASILIVVVVVAFQYVFQSALMNQVDIEAVLQNRVDFVRLIGSLFPPSIWATRAISRAGTLAGLVNLAYLLGASGASVALFLFVGQKVFYGGLVGGNEQLRKGLKFDQKAVLREAVQAPSIKALILREIRLFMRMPIWVMNGFISVILIPLLALFPTFIGGQGLEQIAAVIRTAPNGIPLATVVVAATIVMLTSLNTLASTAISREGKHLWISRSIPVSGALQVKAKMSFALLAALISAAPIVVLFTVLLKPPILYTFLAYTLGIVAGVAPQAFGLLYDMWRPFLTWTNPQHAVKNNLNALSSGIIMLPIGLVSYVAYQQLIGRLGQGVLVILLLAHLALAIGSYMTVVKLADRLYHHMDITE